MTFRAAILCTLLVTATAEDLRNYQRADGGYDFFDFAGMLVSYSVRNDKESWDFFDRTGRLTGWSDERSAGQIDFYDATGAHYRTVHISVNNAHVVTSDLGQIYNFLAPSSQGGVYQINLKGEITSFSTSSDYVVVKPDTASP